jgi:DNA-binding transcriptional regulator YhcF (GntR family)
MPRKPKTEVSDEQKEVYFYIIKHVEDHGFQPSVRELAEQFGINQASMYQRLKLLARKGFVELTGGERSIILHHVTFRAELGEEARRLQGEPSE